MGDEIMKCCASFVCVILLSVTGVAANADQPTATARAPIPDAQAQAEARKTASEMYASRFQQAKNATDKAALAAELIDAAMKIQNGSAGQFVLLKIARDIAAGAGDAATALRAVDRLAQRFELSAASWQADSLLTAARQATSSAQAKAVAEAAVTVIGKLADASQYNEALDLCEAARSAAQRAKEYALVRQLTDKATELRRVRKEWQEYRDAIALLENNPTDPAASLVAGRYLCFVKGDWERGIARLAAGSDAELKAAAAKDQRGANSAEEQAAVGDAWWNLAETHHGPERDGLLLRARHWYRQAEPNLTGSLNGLKVKQRLEQVLARGPSGFNLDDAIVILTFEPSTITKTNNGLMVKDLSKHQNHGIVSGGSPTKGKIGAALSFDGKDDYVQFDLRSDVTPRKTDVLTVAMWFLAQDSRRCNFLFEGGGDTQDLMMRAYLDSSAIYFGAPGRDLRVSAGLIGDWHHFVGIWENSRLRVFLDGEQAGERAGNFGDTVFGIKPTRIGTQVGGFYGPPPKRESRCFSGVIDEFLLLRRALSPAEIKKLYQMGLDGRSLE